MFKQKAPGSLSVAVLFVFLPPVSHEPDQSAALYMCLEPLEF